MKIYSAVETAAILGVDPSRVLFLCRQKRLGYTLPKTPRGGWQITENEIDTYKALGPRPPGKPKKPKPQKLGWKRWSGVPKGD